MILEEDIRAKFETWATENGQNLTRHPNNNDFYFNKEVSMMWVCYAMAYGQGRLDENASMMDMLEQSIPTPELSVETEALIERIVELDE